jgi:glycosyltransferase involved in cell wall biosynthesis
VNGATVNRERLTPPAMTYLLINYEYPPLGGGAATVSKNLAQALTCRGNRVIVLTSAYKDYRGTSNEGGIEVFRIPALRRSIHRSGIMQMTAYILSAVRRVPRIAEEYQVERILAFFSIPGGVVARWLQTRRSIPYAVTLRGGDVPGTEPGLGIFYKVLTGLRREILRRARYVCAPSTGLKNLSESADPIKVQVIPNGVDCDYFKPGPKTADTTLSLLSVGRLHRQKNVSLTLQILLAIRNRFGTPATARIIGDGPEKVALENFARRNNLLDAIAFEGWLPRDELAAAYQSATLLVQISSYEGMSNSMLEALASGLPVVASLIPENMELISPEWNGLLFDSKEDASNIAQAIVRLHRNPERLTQMRINAREHVAARYSWDNVAEAYESSFGR